jgi:hypothetical protein
MLKDVADTEVPLFPLLKQRRHQPSNPRSTIMRGCRWDGTGGSAIQLDVIASTDRRAIGSTQSACASPPADAGG